MSVNEYRWVRMSINEYKWVWMSVNEYKWVWMSNNAYMTHANEWRDVLQHTATHCNTLQHTTTHCNTLQHTATSHVTLVNARCNVFTCALSRTYLTMSSLLNYVRYGSVTHSYVLELVTQLCQIWVRDSFICSRTYEWVTNPYLT